jgi:hypothetical protein
MNNNYKNQSDLENEALRNHKLKLLLDSLEKRGRDRIVCHWDYIGELYDRFRLLNNITVKKFIVISGLSPNILPHHTNLCHCSQDNLVRNYLIYNQHTRIPLTIGSECIRRFMKEKKLVCCRCKIKKVNKLHLSNLMMCSKCYSVELETRILNFKKHHRIKLLTRYFNNLKIEINNKKRYIIKQILNDEIFLDCIDFETLFRSGLVGNDIEILKKTNFIMDFGKYKNTEFNKIDIGYIDWMKRAEIRLFIKNFRIYNHN